MGTQREDTDNEHNLYDPGDWDEHARQNHAAHEYGEDKEIEIGQVASIEHGFEEQEASDGPIDEQDVQRGTHASLSRSIQEGDDQAASCQDEDRRPEAVKGERTGEKQPDRKEASTRMALMSRARRSFSCAAMLVPKASACGPVRVDHQRQIAGGREGVENEGSGSGMGRCCL